MSGSFASGTLLYVSGPMSGLPEFNFPAFESAAARLRSWNYRVISPHDLGQVDAWSWADYLRRDLLVMLAAGPDLGGIATLPDGPTMGRAPSKGLALETRVARELGIEVKPVDEWVELQRLGGQVGGAA
jgi:hypothetical protein